MTQITKRLICLWKDCDEVFEEAAAFKVHVDKHFHELMQTDLDNQRNDGTEKQQEEEDEPPTKKAKLNEDKMANAVDIGKCKTICMAIEVWTDVFGFVKRIQLARTVSLTNRHIYQICWPRLHGNKVEAYQIEEITISCREHFDRDRPPKALVLKNDKLLPMPSCPLPSYISGFGKITIKILDQKVLEFFNRILPCLARVVISWNFNGSDAKQCAMVDQLLNIFRDGLPTICLYAFCPLSNIQFQYLPDIDNKMELIGLSLWKLSDIPILMKMLASSRPDGQQRVIHILPCKGYLISNLLDTIKKDFRSSTQRLRKPFYIRFYRLELDLQRSAETNEQTDEQLTIMPTVDNDQYHVWEICRHPRGQHEQWAEDGRKRFASASESGHLTTSIHMDLE